MLTCGGAWTNLTASPGQLQDSARTPSDRRSSAARPPRGIAHHRLALHDSRRDGLGRSVPQGSCQPQKQPPGSADAPVTDITAAQADRCGQPVVFCPQTVGPRRPVEVTPSVCQCQAPARPPGRTGGERSPNSVTAQEGRADLALRLRPPTMPPAAACLHSPNVPDRERPRPGGRLCRTGPRV